MTNSEVTMQETRSPHGMKNRIARVMWAVVYTFLYRPSPRPLHRWRVFLLRLFGANVHRTAHVYPRSKVWGPWNLTLGEHACLSDDVDVYCVERIHIGAYSTISQYSYLCGATHDYKQVRHPLVPMPITIGRRAWVAADVFVGPGVTIGDGAVVGARSTVLKDLPSWMVCAGTPARALQPRGLGPEDFGESPTDSGGHE